MRIGIVGARLSGSYLALLLSRMGHETLLFDGGLRRHKPCGGGVTGKALSRVSWLRTASVPHTVIDALELGAPGTGPAVVDLKHPIHVFGRQALDSALRDDALSSGARLIPLHASHYARRGNRWSIVADRTLHEVDFLVGADGATSGVRRAVSSCIDRADLSLALGIYVPGARHRNRILVAFQERGFQGYLWSFPRVDHLALGILCWLPRARAFELRRRIAEFAARHYPDAGSGGRPYAACIPCLSEATLRLQQVCGPDWALVGDAAGFVDSLTGEGIYYAFRSAELLAGAIERGSPVDYERAWRTDFGADLAHAARMRRRFYDGRFLGRSYVDLSLHWLRASRASSCLSDALIAGQINYLRFTRSVAYRTPAVLLDLLRSRTGTRAKMRTYFCANP